MKCSTDYLNKRESKGNFEVDRRRIIIICYIIIEGLLMRDDEVAFNGLSHLMRLI